MNSSNRRLTRAHPPRQADDLDALDQYATQLWETKLPTAAPAHWLALHLVWLTVGFSVRADRAAAHDYVCELNPLEIAARAHLSHDQANPALAALVDAGHLEPVLVAADRAGYRVIVDRPQGRAALPEKGFAVSA